VTARSENGFDRLLPDVTHCDSNALQCMCITSAIAGW